MSDEPDIAEVQERACALANAQCDDEQVECKIASEFELSRHVAGGHVSRWRTLLEQERIAGAAQLRESLYRAALHAGTSDGLKAAMWLSTQYLGFSGQGPDNEMRKLVTGFAKMTKQQQVEALRKALHAIEGASVLGGAH